MARSQKPKGRGCLGGPIKPPKPLLTLVRYVADPGHGSCDTNNQDMLIFTPTSLSICVISLKVKQHIFLQEMNVPRSDLTLISVRAGMTSLAALSSGFRLSLEAWRGNYLVVHSFI